MSWVKDFCDQFNIKVAIKNLKDNLGGYACEDNIVLNKKYFRQRKPEPYDIHLVCHEICHVLCRRHGPYKKAHRNRNSKYQRRIGLKKELFVDKMADKMVRSLFPDLPLAAASYTRDKEIRDWYRANFRDKYFPKTKRGK